MAADGAERRRAQQWIQQREQRESLLRVRASAAPRRPHIPAHKLRRWRGAAVRALTALPRDATCRRPAQTCSLDQSAALCPAADVAGGILYTNTSGMLSETYLRGEKGGGRAAAWPAGADRERCLGRIGNSKIRRSVCRGGRGRAQSAPTRTAARNRAPRARGGNGIVERRRWWLALASAVVRGQRLQAHLTRGLLALSLQPAPISRNKTHSSSSAAMMASLASMQGGLDALRVDGFVIFVPRIKVQGSQPRK